MATAKSNNIEDVKIANSKKKYTVAGIEFEAIHSAPSSVRYNIATAVGEIVVKDAEQALLREYILWVNIVAGYTNILLPDFSTIGDICRIYDLIERSGIKAKLLDVIDYLELKEINDRIDDYINIHNGNHVAKHDYIGDVTYWINKISKPDGYVVKQLKKIAEKING